MAGLLSIEKGTDVYLDNIEVVIPDALKTSYAYETVAQYGPAAASGPSPSRPITMQSPELGKLVYPSPVVTSTTATEDYGLVSFSWQVATPMPRGGTKMVTQSASMQILNNEYVETAGHYHVKYNVGAVSKYWIYQAGLGTYPSLDLAANQSEQVGQFFPLIHFRTGQQSLAADTASAGYKASAQMAKILGIGYDETIDAIHENPDIGSVMQSYLTLSVPAVSTNPLEQRYLYEFFDQLYESRQAASLPLTEVTSTPLNRVAKFNNANQSAIQISDTLIKTS